MPYSFIDNLVYGDWLETYLPDFVLAFAFFTGLIFAVLSRRMGLKRSVGMVAASLGAALATGLVWWERENGYSIRSLGPIAVGFAIIILGGVIYQSIRATGGSWAGSGIAIGACLLVGWMLGFDWPVATGVIQTVAGAALTVGILAFLIHHKGLHGHAFAPAQGDGRYTHNLEDVRHDRNVSEFLGRNLKRAKNWATALHEHPDRADDVMLQLKRMLPAEGWLTDRMARLRERAHRIRNGHVSRIDELRKLIPKMAPASRRRLGTELSARYKELQLDVRLERLDKACAENERRIRALTKNAKVALERNEHRNLVDLLAEATRLQAHNSKLFKAIDRTDKKLIAISKKIATSNSEVTGA